MCCQLFDRMLIWKHMGHLLNNEERYLLDYIITIIETDYIITIIYYIITTIYYIITTIIIKTGFP